MIMNSELRRWSIKSDFWGKKRIVLESVEKCEAIMAISVDNHSIKNDVRAHVIWQTRSNIYNLINAISHGKFDEAK